MTDPARQSLALHLHAQGVSNRGIARRLRMAKGTVADIVGRGEVKLSAKTKNRPRDMSESEIAAAVAGAAKLRADWVEESQLTWLDKVNLKIRGRDMKWIVELEPNVWLAPWDGDPGRTLKRENAERYESKLTAEKAITKARRYRPFPEAIAVEDHTKGK